MKYFVLSLSLLMFNAYGAEQSESAPASSWWFKIKCYLYGYCLPDGSLGDRTMLPHASVALLGKLFDAIERHSIPDVTYMFDLYERTGRRLEYLDNPYEPLVRAVTCNAPAEIVELICKHVWVAGAADAGESLLQIAAENNNVDTACILLEHGLKPKSFVPANLDKGSKFISLLVNVVEKMPHVSLAIKDRQLRDIYDKKRIERIEAVLAVLNAADAATYGIPKPVNTMIAGYII